MEQLPTTIFYADDDVVDLDFFREVTNEINQPVSLFEEVEKMLYSLRNPPPMTSVIFLDLNMPVKSGFDILRESKAPPPAKNIPVIIFTSSSNPKDIETRKKLRANLYSRKPEPAGSLRKVID